MEQITIVIIDDHPIFRQGVLDVLSIEPCLKVIGQADHGIKGRDMLLALKPDIAIVDVNLPGMNGQQITHDVTSGHIHTRIILMTAYADGDQMLHAATSGASAFCSKDIRPDKLIPLVYQVLAGNYVMGDKVMNRSEFLTWLDQQLAESKSSYSSPGSPFHPLSDREMEVVELMVEGKSNKEIAMQLEISHQTVKNHITSILRKFAVEDRTQAVVYALKRGWVKLNYEKRFKE